MRIQIWLNSERQADRLAKKHNLTVQTVKSKGNETLLKFQGKGHDIRVLVFDLANADIGDYEEGIVHAETGPEDYTGHSVAFCKKLACPGVSHPECPPEVNADNFRKASIEGREK